MLTSSSGSLNAGRGVKFAKILLTSYLNAPLIIYLVNYVYPAETRPQVELTLHRQSNKKPYRRARAKVSCIGTKIA